MNYETAYRRLKKRRTGRRVLSRFRKFWGVDDPPKLKVIGSGPGNIDLVDLGTCPHVNLADGPHGRSRRRWKIKKRGILACNPSGTRLYVLSGKTVPGKPKRFLGYCPMTEYIPSVEIERMGSFKKGRHWQHEHNERGGRWPKLYSDGRGNIIYGRGSYRVGKWIER